jgi:hypothetical protein
MQDPSLSGKSASDPLPSPPGPETVSHLKPSELVSLAMQLRAHADGEWQRAVNLHAALIAVMIFFAGQSDPFVTARLIVFAFYTYNVIMLLRALIEARAGLSAVTDDLMLLPAPARGGHSLRWLTARRPSGDPRFQIGLLAVVWTVIGYLMLSSILLGRDAM